MLALLAFASVSLPSPVAAQTSKPTLQWSFLQNGRTLAVRAVSRGAGFRSLRVWGTAPGSPEALPTAYRPLGTLSYEGADAVKANQGAVLVPLPKGACAVYAEVRYRVEGREFALTSPTHVYRP